MHNNKHIEKFKKIDKKLQEEKEEINEQLELLENHGMTQLRADQHKEIE